MGISVTSPQKKRVLPLPHETCSPNCRMSQMFQEVNLNQHLLMCIVLSMNTLFFSSCILNPVRLECMLSQNAVYTTFKHVLVVRNCSLFIVMVVVMGLNMGFTVFKNSSLPTCLQGMSGHTCVPSCEAVTFPIKTVDFWSVENHISSLYTI